MAKLDLGDKTVRELRTMAKRAGIAVKREWKKKDLVKALSSKKKSAAKPVKPAKPAKKTKQALSRAVKPPPELVLAPLPAEYGGDTIVSMQVTPSRIYVYWEVTEDRLVKYEGSLNLKVLDTKENWFFYEPVLGRIGESFININPDSDCTVEIGIIDSGGEFVNIIQPESTAVAGDCSDITNEGSRGDISLCERPAMIGPAQKVEQALPEEFFEAPESASSY